MFKEFKIHESINFKPKNRKNTLELLPYVLVLNNNINMEDVVQWVRWRSRRLQIHLFCHTTRPSYGDVHLEAPLEDRRRNLACRPPCATTSTSSTAAKPIAGACFTCLSCICLYHCHSKVHDSTISSLVLCYTSCHLFQLFGSTVTTPRMSLFYELTTRIPHLVWAR